MLNAPFQAIEAIVDTRKLALDQLLERGEALVYLLETVVHVSSQVVDPAIRVVDSLIHLFESTLQVCCAAALVNDARYHREKDHHNGCPLRKLVEQLR